MSNVHHVNNDTTARALTGGGWFWIDADVIRFHARAVGAVGIAVYNVLALMADSNQECFPSQKHIGDLLGYSRATVNKAVKALMKRGLVEVTKKSAQHCRYRLLKPGCQAGETGMSNRGNHGVPLVDTNNTQLTRINNHTVVSVKNNDISPDRDFKPTTREELLALDLATGIGEVDSILWCLSLAKRHPEGLLRRALSEARETPDAEIRKSRRALFNHLLKKHAQETNDHSGGQPRDEVRGTGRLQGC